LPQYIPAFIPYGTFFFMVTLIEGLGKLMMLTKGGMRYAFPPYVLRAHYNSLIFGEQLSDRPGVLRLQKSPRYSMAEGQACPNPRIELLFQQNLCCHKKIGIFTY